MLVMRIYSLFDRVSKEYGPLMIGRNDEAHERALRDQLSEGSTVSKHPQDYDLFHMGSVDMETGVIASSAPQFVRNMLDVFRGPSFSGSPVDRDLAAAESALAGR